MENKKTQINFQREGANKSASGFIIDLRSSVLAPPKNNNQSLPRLSIFKKFNERSKMNFSAPDLLALASRRRFSLAFLKKSSSFLKAAFRGGISKINPHFLRRNNNWLKNYQNKLSEFRKAVNKSARHLQKNFKTNQNYFKRRRLLEARLLFYRSIWSFLFILILIVIPFKAFSYWRLFDLDKLEANIMTASQAAFANLLAAGGAVENFDFNEAESALQKATDNFLEAGSELDKIGETILFFASWSSDEKIKLAAESKKFIQAGVQASYLGKNLLSAYDSLFNNDTENLSDRLDNLINFGNLAVSNATQLSEELKKIKSENLPSEYRQRFEDLKNQADLISSNLAVFIGSADKFQKILGISEDKRYLLVFQNNAELRASGGFLGSYALVDIRDGKIRNLEIPGGGSYDTEGGLKMKVAAPPPLWLVSTRWHFWDANWWPDWPKTANNLMWFYEKSGGPTVDGVISLTPTVIEDLLEVTGPIDLQAEYGLIIDADNFWEAVQMTVEKDNLKITHPEIIANFPDNSEKISSAWPLEQDLERNSDNKPKKIIGDLTVKILDNLSTSFDREKLTGLMSLLEKNLSSKQILFYFKDAYLQEEFSKRNWSGEIKETNRDYLAVINTNIAGQKTDRKIFESIEHYSQVDDNGEIINTLKITRNHTGLKNEPLYGVRSVNWLRVYVPLGSELISAEGFISPDPKYLQDKPESDWIKLEDLEAENQAQIDSASGTIIYNDSGKTVFANWLMIDPGESRTIILNYRLPFNFFTQSEKSFQDKLRERFFPDIETSFDYSLLAQKQAGAISSSFVSRLTLPSSLKTVWAYPDAIKESFGWQINSELNTDKYWSILVK